MQTVEQVKEALEKQRAGDVAGIAGARGQFEDGREMLKRKRVRPSYVDVVHDARELQAAAPRRDQRGDRVGSGR